MERFMVLPMLFTASMAVAQTAGSAAPPPACPEGRSMAGRATGDISPPVFVRRADSPRLMVFVHALQGDGTTSWFSRGNVYWPALVASDPDFADFDVFVHEYVVRPTGAIRLADAAEQFVQVATQHKLVSQYRDVVFVTEGDGAYYIRELLQRVRAFTARATMIFVAGRTDETANPMNTDAIKILDSSNVLAWPDYLSRSYVSWESLGQKPLTHCAVLGGAQQTTVDRDLKSSFCSSMPLVIEGADWRSLRPSCYADPIHAALKRSIQRYPLNTQTKAAPASEVVGSSTVRVPCEQTLEQMIEIPLNFNPESEELITYDASVRNTGILRAAKAWVQQVSGNIAIVRYILTGRDRAKSPSRGGAASFPGDGAEQCVDTSATIDVKFLKRPKG